LHVHDNERKTRIVELDSFRDRHDPKKLAHKHQRLLVGGRSMLDWGALNGQGGQRCKRGRDIRRLQFIFRVWGEC
jgi:hypothetical protein